MTRGRVIALAALVALLAGVAAGAYGATVTRQSAIGGPPIQSLGVATGVVFHRTQVEADFPDLASPGTLRPKSFRRLGSVPKEGVTLYAAMDRSGSICLVAGPGLLQAACATPAAFDAAGLELQFQGNRGDGASTAGSNIDRVLAEWLPSGQVGFAVTPGG